MGQPSSGIGVVDKSVAILGCVAAAPRTLAELVAATALPRATAHRLAVALEVHRLLDRDGEGRFVLGPRVARTGRGPARSAGGRGRRRCWPGCATSAARARSCTAATARERVCVAAAERAHRAAHHRAGRHAAAADRRVGRAGAVRVVGSRDCSPTCCAGAEFGERTLAEVRRRGWAQSVAQREAGRGVRVGAGARRRTARCSRRSRSPGRSSASAAPRRALRPVLVAGATPHHRRACAAGCDQVCRAAVTAGRDGRAIPARWTCGGRAEPAATSSGSSRSSDAIGRRWRITLARPAAGRICGSRDPLRRDHVGVEDLVTTHGNQFWAFALSYRGDRPAVARPARVAAPGHREQSRADSSLLCGQWRSSSCRSRRHCVPAGRQSGCHQGRSTSARWRVQFGLPHGVAAIIAGDRGCDDLGRAAAASHRRRPPLSSSRCSALTDLPRQAYYPLLLLLISEPAVALVARPVARRP